MGGGRSRAVGPLPGDAPRRRPRVGRGADPRPSTPPSGPSSTPASRSPSASGPTRRTRSRRLRRLLTGVALLLVVALVAGTLALVQRSRASRAADRAEGQAEAADATRLAAQATSLAGSRLDLALALAVEGHRLHPTVETEGALWTVLGATPPGLERLVHFDPPATFAGVSTDGRLLAAPGEDGSVRLIDTGSGHEVRRLVGHRTGALYATFTGDDRHVAAGGDDGRVIVWDVASGRRLGPPLDAGAGPAYGVFDPTDGTRLYTASYDGVVTAWDLTDPERPRSVELFRHPVPGAVPGLPTVVLPSGDGGRLLVGPFRGPSHLWDVRRGELLARGRRRARSLEPRRRPPSPWLGAPRSSSWTPPPGRSRARRSAASNSPCPSWPSTPTVSASPPPSGTAPSASSISPPAARRGGSPSMTPSRLPGSSPTEGCSPVAPGWRRSCAWTPPPSHPWAGCSAVRPPAPSQATFTADGTGVVTGDDNGRARTWDAVDRCRARQRLRGRTRRTGPAQSGRPHRPRRPRARAPRAPTTPRRGGSGPRSRPAARAGAAVRPPGAGTGRSSPTPERTALESTLWDLADPDHPHQVARLRPDGPTDTPVGWTEFSADGRRIAVARLETGPVTVFDSATGRPGLGGAHTERELGSGHLQSRSAAPSPPRVSAQPLRPGARIGPAPARAGARAPPGGASTSSTSPPATGEGSWPFRN